jgi:RNA-directed DNA polymerase
MRETGSKAEKVLRWCSAISSYRTVGQKIKKSRHMRAPLLIDKLTTKLRGHYNYFGAVGNYSSMKIIYDHAVDMLYKWLNRRSGRKSMTWDKLKRVIAYRRLAKPWCTARKITKRVTW